MCTLGKLSYTIRTPTTHELNQKLFGVSPFMLGDGLCAGTVMDVKSEKHHLVFSFSTFETCEF